MNYFAPKTAAERYATGRPDFHANTIRHIKEYLQLSHKLPNALDTACGTGLSTKALLEIADQVYGTDASPEMLSHAPLPEKIHYSIAFAEQQPFPDQLFDLITVSSGVHWFDIDKFLAEAHRLLKPGGWLVIYENHFIAEMEGFESFAGWFPDVYLKRYPSPPRNNDYPWVNENLQTKGFSLVHEERFKNAVDFTKKKLALYFTTHSNIIDAVENRGTAYEVVEEWLYQELTPYFANDDTIRTIRFGNWIRYIQRVNY
jgi:ubiquinone/menaquinone biosynthesis C-methylase UbiE